MIFHSGWGKGKPSETERINGLVRLSRVTAVILAGGLGTRLRAVLEGRQKVIAEVKKRPFLGYLLDHIVAAGIRHVVLCTGYLGPQVKEAFGRSYQGMRLEYSEEASPLGTGGALRLAMPRLPNGPVLVMNGDSFCSVDLNRFSQWHSHMGAEGSIVLVETTETGRYGRVKLADDGRVLRFEEKSNRGGPGWINAGVYLLSQNIISGIPPDKAVSLERDVFPTWIGQGLYGYQSSGCFIDIGTPDDYASAEDFFSVLTRRIPPDQKA